MMLLIVTMGTFPFVVCLFTSGGRAWNNRATLFLQEHSFSFLASDSSHCLKLTNMTSVHTFNQFVKKNKTEKCLIFFQQIKSNQSPSFTSFYKKNVHCFVICFSFDDGTDISSDWL